MKKTSNLLFILFLLLPSTALAALPNIIFILVDDMGWSDIGPYGSEIDTPNLDILAADGLRFTQFSNTAKCFPSRATLLSGQYAQKVGMAIDPLSELTNAVTLAEVLKTKDYRTLMVGKHHGIDNPFDRGFDHYYGLRDGATNHFNPGLQRPGEAKPAQKQYGERTFCFDEECITPYTPKNDDYYSTDTYTDWALEFLDRYKEEQNPYFLYLSFQAPHDPLQAWPKDIEKYEGRYDVGYEEIAMARYQKQTASKLIDGTFPRSAPTYKDWSSLSEEEKKEQSHIMAVYAAMIDRVDQNIGRILAKLKEQGELENTLIMFASDNGSSAQSVQPIGDGEIGSIDRWTSLGEDWANVGNTPYRKFKNYSHQGGIITPFIINWPIGLKAKGEISDFPGHLIDVMATFLDITNAEYPSILNGTTVTPFDGQSLLPIINGQTISNRDKPLYWNWQNTRAMRDGEWKIVSHAVPKAKTDGPWELYNMNIDKTETNNVAQEYPEIVNQMNDQYLAWFNKMSKIEN